MLSLTLQNKLTIALDACLKAFSMFGSRIAVCFSGGKDATVVLDVVSHAYKMMNRDFPLKAYFLELPDEFPDVLDFI
jgi:predicted phosphoadenosine phosphosulfate sulfurtransferase